MNALLSAEGMVDVYEQGWWSGTEKGVGVNRISNLEVKYDARAVLDPSSSWVNLNGVAVPPEQEWTITRSLRVKTHTNSAI